MLLLSFSRSLAVALCLSLLFLTPSPPLFFSSLSNSDHPSTHCHHLSLYLFLVLVRSLSPAGFLLSLFDSFSCRLKPNGSVPSCETHFNWHALNICICIEIHICLRLSKTSYSNKIAKHKRYDEIKIFFFIHFFAAQQLSLTHAYTGTSICLCMFLYFSFFCYSNDCCYFISSFISFDFNQVRRGIENRKRSWEQAVKLWKVLWQRELRKRP